jgi:hypothetical protein
VRFITFGAKIFDDARREVRIVFDYQDTVCLWR